MSQNNKRFIHLTHGDLDGAGCGVLSGMICPERELFAGPFQAVPHFINKQVSLFEKNECKQGDVILLMTSVSMEKKDFRKAIDTFGKENVLLIDHHPETVSLSEFPNVIYAKNQCATMKMYNAITLCGTGTYEKRLMAIEPYIKEQDESFFLKTSLMKEELFDLINVWDMWLVEDNLRPHAERLNDFFLFLRFNDFVKKMIDYSNNPNEFGIQSINFNTFEIMETLQKETSDYLKIALERSLCYEVSELNLRVAWCVASRNVSRLGEQMLLKHGADVAVIYNIEYGTIHFRTGKNSKVHAGNMARAILGGGGHATLGGGRFDYLHISKTQAGDKPVIMFPSIDAVKPMLKKPGIGAPGIKF